MIAATLYQGNPDRKPQALEYLTNWEIYIPYAGAAESLLNHAIINQTKMHLLRAYVISADIFYPSEAVWITGFVHT